MTAPAMNSRMGRALPDVPASDLPLVRALLDTLAIAERGPIGDWSAAVIALLKDPAAADQLAAWSQATLDAGSDLPLARVSQPDRDYTLQILHLAPGEVHPCHCHHNVASVQMVLAGRVTAREYDRLGWTAGGLLRLRPVFDGMLEPSDLLSTSEWSRNAHWFAADEARPAALLNFNIRGYEKATFLPLETRPLGRRLLDPTMGADGDALLAAIVTPDIAYARFAGRPLADFPQPRLAGLETQP